MILGIETSCDETAAAVVTGDGDVRANVVSSQAELHVPRARFHAVLASDYVEPDAVDPLYLRQPDAERKR